MKKRKQPDREEEEAEKIPELIRLGKSWREREREREGDLFLALPVQSSSLPPILFQLDFVCVEILGLAAK